MQPSLQMVGTWVSLHWPDGSTQEGKQEGTQDEYWVWMGHSRAGGGGGETFIARGLCARPQGKKGVKTALPPIQCGRQRSASSPATLMCVVSKCVTRVRVQQEQGGVRSVAGEKWSPLSKVPVIKWKCSRIARIYNIKESVVPKLMYTFHMTPIEHASVILHCCCCLKSIYLF